MRQTNHGTCHCLDPDGFGLLHGSDPASGIEIALHPKCMLRARSLRPDGSFDAQEVAVASFCPDCGRRLSDRNLPKQTRTCLCDDDSRPRFRDLNPLTAPYSGIRLSISPDGLLRAVILDDAGNAGTQATIRIGACPVCGRKFGHA